MRTLGEQEEME